MHQQHLYPPMTLRDRLTLATRYDSVLSVHIDVLKQKLSRLEKDNPQYGGRWYRVKFPKTPDQLRERFTVTQEMVSVRSGGPEAYLTGFLEADEETGETRISFSAYPSRRTLYGMIGLILFLVYAGSTQSQSLGHMLILLVLILICLGYMHALFSKRDELYQRVVRLVSAFVTISPESDTVSARD
jgi:uncharacterized membrane protein